MLLEMGGVKGIMQKLSVAVLISLILLTYTGWAFGQTQPKAQATIPFEFWIGGSRLPAGQYIIERVESTSYLLFRSSDGKTIKDVYTLPLDDQPAKQDEATLVFRIQDGKHYLYGGWGAFGSRVVSLESTRPAPSGDDRAEVKIIYR